MRLAAPRGYCAGVDRAVITVEKALDLYGAPVYVRKQIVHNKHVVSDLESRGAVFVEELDEVPEGATVVFSAHGVSPAVHDEAQGARPEDHRRHLPAGDQGPPRGEAVRRRRLRHPPDRPRRSRGGRGDLGRGARAHPARAGSRPTSPAIVVRDPAKVAWLSQTTLSVDETLETVDAIRERFPELLDPPSDDICYATQNRQLAVKEIAHDADLVIVVGSANSSNSVRLAEVALEAGAKAAHRVDDASEIDDAWLDGVSTVSVTSGASVPEALVDGVLSLPHRAGLPRRRGGAQRRGVAHLRVAAGAADGPAGSGQGLTPPRRPRGRHTGRGAMVASHSACRSSALEEPWVTSQRRSPVAPPASPSRPRSGHTTYR